MAGVRLAALVDINALVVLRLKSRLAVADGQVVLGSAGALAARHSGTWVNALEVLGITGSVSRAVLTCLALNLVATNVRVGGVTPMSCRTGTVGLVLNGLASGLFGAEGEVARVLAPAPRRRRVQGAGVLVGALGVGGTFVGLNAPGGYVADHAGWTPAFVRPELVEADHGRRADRHGRVAAFVDVGTALGGLDEALGARALPVQAELAVLAVVLDVATWLADLIDTNFALETVLVRVTELQTDAVVALFAPGTVSVQGTRRHAEASVADLAGRASLGRAANFGNSDAAFSGRRHAGEAGGALAGFSLVLGGADGVGAARSAHRARVLAAVLDADVLAWTVPVIGAASDTDSAPAGLAVGALLGGDAGELALSGQALLAVLELAATDFRRRVRLVAWRAGTPVGVVLHCADCSLPTHVSLADVEAGVGEPVAELVGRAVVVLDAVDRLAALAVGVSSEESWWAGTLSNVISGHADGRRAAAQGTASRYTGSLISGHPAHFSLLALGVARTALDGRHTSGSAVWTSGEAHVALAESLVVVGDADGVGGADDGVANVDAGSSPEHALPADLAGPALSVAGASGDNLADAGQLVLGVALLAGAQRATVDDLAAFGVRAGHDLAGVEAGPPSVDVDLADEAFRAVGVLFALLFRETTLLEICRVP